MRTILCSLATFKFNHLWVGLCAKGINNLKNQMHSLQPFDRNEQFYMLSPSG